MKVSFFFALYDFWVGAYWDRRARVLYLCPLPCCVIKIERRWRHAISSDPLAATADPGVEGWAGTPRKPVQGDNR